MSGEVQQQSAAETARGYFEALAARDPDRMATFWSPDGIEDVAGVGILRGPAEVAEFFRGLVAAIPDLEWVVERITADERVAAVQWRASGTFTGSQLMGIEPTGKLLDWRGCDCLEVEDGRIVRNSAYQDSLTLMRGVGLLPPQDSGPEKAMFAAFNATTKVRQALRERFA